MQIELVFLLQTAMTWRTAPANDLCQGDQVTYIATYVESLFLKHLSWSFWKQCQKELKTLIERVKMADVNVARGYLLFPPQKCRMTALLRNSQPEHWLPNNAIICVSVKTGLCHFTSIVIYIYRLYHSSPAGLRKEVSWWKWGLTGKQRTDFECIEASFVIKELGFFL